MVSCKVFSSLAILCPALAYGVCTYTWNTGLGSWGTMADWTQSGTGCASTYPGQTGTTDIANFATTGATITTNVSPSINQMNFSTGSGNYTISGSDTVTFVGSSPALTTTAGSQTVSAPIALNLTSATLTITLGTNLTLSGGISDTSGSSSLTLASGSGTLINTGRISVGGTINLNGGVLENTHIVNTSTGALRFSGANVTSNYSMTSPFSCNTPLMQGSTVDISGGTITLLSDSTCGSFSVDGDAGTTLQGLNGLTMENGTVSLTNNSVINGPGPNGSQGVLFVGDGMTISGGTLTATNNGTIATNSNNIGIYIQNEDFTSSVPLTFSGGTITAVNNGIITNGIGIKINSGTTLLSSPIIMSGGTLNLTNTGAISNISSPSFGSLMTGSTITTSGSGTTLNMTNSGIVSGDSSNVGSYLVATENMTLGAGTWTVANNSSITAGTGVEIYGLENVTLQGISINMSNNANLSAAGTGGAFMVGDTLSFPSGTSVLTLQNNNPVSGTVVAGVLATVQNFGDAATAVSMAAGTLNIDNLGSVGGTAEAGAQFTVMTNDFVQTGGTILVSNASPITSTYSGGPLGAALTATGGTGNITLNGNFLMNNSGTVSAAGAGTAAGAAVIAAGGLNLGVSASVTNTGSVSGVNAVGSLCEGEALSFTMGSPVIFTNMGIVSNSSTNVGILLLAKTGNITMSGTSTFTLNNNAAISLGTGMELKAALGSLFMNSGSLDITNTSAISGGFGAQLNIVAGNLTIENSATRLKLSNTSSSTLTGGTGVFATVGNNFSITTGNLILNNTATLTGSANGAGMVVNGSTFSQTGGAITVVNTAPFSGAGVASFITSAAPITIGGTGVFTLASSTPTTINSVDVIVTAPSVTINAGGTYQATGTTASNLFNNGGTYVAGVADPAAGSHTITGNLTQNSGDYAIVIGNFNNAAPSTNVSFTQVDGTVDWVGGTFNLLEGTGFNIPAPGKYAIWFLNSDNPIIGDGSNLTINALPGMSRVYYQTRGAIGNEGWIVFNFNLPVKPINPIPYQPITISTINLLNSILGGELLRLQDRLATGGQAESATDKNCKVDKYGRLKCKKKPNKKTAHNAAAANLKGPASSPTVTNPVFAANPQLGFMNHNQEVQKEQLEFYNRKADKPWNVYVGPLGDFGSINNKSSQLGANYWYAGGLAGFDYAFSQVGVGLMVDYERVTAKLHKKGGNFDMNQFHATAYSTYVPASFPQFALNSMIGAGGAWFNIHRNVLDEPEKKSIIRRHIFAEPVKESTHAKTQGAIVDALIGSQYLFAHRQFNAIPRGLEIVPLINLQYIYEGVAGYKERGAGLNDFKFHKQGFQSLRSSLGTWLQYTVLRDNFSFTPLFNIAWQREFLDHNSTVHATAIQFHQKEKVRIIGAGRNTLLTGLDLMFEFYNKYGIEASYEFEYNSLYRNNGFYLGFNVKF